MDFTTHYLHWDLSVDDKSVLWLGINRHESAVNSLNKEVLHELDQILDNIADETSIKSVIIFSKKKTGFIAGADISQFVSLTSSEEAFNLIRQGQLVFEKLANLTKPTVAMIDGFCLGGGMELALACRYRVAEDSSHTRLGLPEVLLGIIPGWGGTVRLPLLIGAPNAMKLILTGRLISAKEAKKYGMIDAAVPKRVLINAACHYALTDAPPHHPNLFVSLTNHGFVRPLLAKLFKNKLKAKVNEEHYPAPYIVVRNWEELGPESSQALQQEAKSISELMVHPTGRNLVRVFFLKERLKSLAKGLSFRAQHVHVIGAGTMGSAIAAWCALSGLNVTLQDQKPAYLASGYKKANEIFRAKLKSARDIQSAFDRLTPDIEGRGIAKADVVIEAIIENLAAKQALYKSIEGQLKPHAILATNTSSIPLADLSNALADPTRLVGIHFFNPVEKMELVEVVAEEATNKDAVNHAIAFIKQINRLPLPVLSKPGFLVNRILMPYLLESMLLYQEGIPANTIDQYAKDFGMPMGPIELVDRVGLDICLSVAEILTPYLGGEVPALLRAKVAEGKLGVKTAEGFYQYQGGKVLKPMLKEGDQKVTLPYDVIVDRLVLRMLNEACVCLREGIVADADLLDAGMIFGTGFAPFRGGPMHYAKTRGYNDIVNRLNQFASQYGKRFEPDSYWQQLVNSSNPPSIKRDV